MKINGYRNAAKIEWRHEVWQHIATHCREVDGFVLTLAGQSFLDRKAAARAGVPAARIIGVDLDRESHRHNVTHGRTVINLPLHEVIPYFNRPIAAVNADFCCTAGAAMVQQTIRSFLCAPTTREALLVVNVAVGRERAVKVRDNDTNEPKYIKGFFNDTQRAYAAISLYGVKAFAEILANRLDCHANDLPRRAWEKLSSLLVLLLEESAVGQGTYIGPGGTRMDWFAVRQFAPPIMCSPWTSEPRIAGHIRAKMAHHTMRHY